MRETLSNLLVEAASESDDFIVLSGDHGYALFDQIRASHPSQFVNVGVCEQNMIGVAAGLARTGHFPVVYGLAAFVPIRVLEQVKLDLCYSLLPVIILGDGAGLVYSTLGVSHQCGEDVACLRALPGIAIYSPCDSAELIACWREARTLKGPAYIRLGKADRPSVHKSSLSNTDPTITADPGRSGGIWVITTGSMVSPCTDIARELGVGCLSVPRLKPFDTMLCKLLDSPEAVIVVEEHSAYGGLYSIVLESLAAECNESRSGGRHPLVRHISLAEHFTHKAGSYQYALSEHGMDDGQLRTRLVDIVGRSQDKATLP